MDAAGGDEDGEADADGGTKNEISIDLERELDLLFIVEESSVMEGVQEQLAEHFPAFMEDLESLPGGLPSINIGVVSTDVGADPSPDADPVFDCEDDGHDGRLIVGEDDSGCPGLDDPWIEGRRTDDGTVGFNFGDDHDLDDVFSCMASLGTAGCGFKMPLEALSRALEHQDNEGFFRDDAYLGVVIVTVEDDCSAHDMEMFAGGPFADLDSELGPLASFRCTDFGITCDDDVECSLERDMRCEGGRENCEPNHDSPYMYHPDHYVDIVREFKGDLDRVIVTGIWGDSGPIEIAHELVNDTEYARSLPTCELPESAAPPEFPDARDVYPPNAPVRLETFLGAFRASEAASICEESLDGPVDRIAARFINDIGSLCVEGDLLDTQPDEDGIQPECSVADVRDPDTDNEERFPLPECHSDRSNTPCWVMQASDACETATGLELEIDRDGRAPPSNTELRVGCVVD